MDARSRVLPVFLGLFAMAPVVPVASGQTTVSVKVSAPTPATTQPDEATKTGELPANVFADEKPKDEGNKATARLQKIQQLTFDRRPSAILKAWSTPAEEPVKKQEPASPPAEGKAESAPPDPFDAELATFRRQVTLGDWAAAGRFLAALPEAEGKALYKRLVSALPSPGDEGSAGRAAQGNNGSFPEKASLLARDVLAVAELAPLGREKETLAGLGRLLRLALSQGDSVEDFITLVRKSQADQSRPGRLADREAARILLASGNPIEAGAFLPAPEKAEADNDREALNLLSVHYLALHGKEKKAVHLERAWQVTMAVLAVGEVDPDQKEEALKRAVELAPKIRDDLGRRWLEDSFTARPDRGMEIIAAIGGSASRGLQAQPFDPDARQRFLELQKTAVEALLATPSGDNPRWTGSLALLAGAWLAEAEFSRQYDQSTSLGPRMQRDIYGNFFYQQMFNEEQNQMNMGNRGNFPRAIPVAKIIEAMPGPAWLARLDEGVKPRYAAVTSSLYLKVGEDEKAFPSIESLAATHPERAREQAEEFLRVWTRNHDPNAERNARNPYVYMFGFERKAESIPLTRSKQERNLKELAGWVARLRKLPFRELDESLIAKAFTACHGAAEVYRIETMEAVLGRFDALKPATLAEMAQQMRTNLGGMWRAPAVQEQNKTKRKEKDIRAEVLRGYEVARSIVDRGLQDHPGDWSLTLARAALAHDENAYRQEIDPSSAFAGRRNAALDGFREAARLYAARVGSMSEDEESSAAFDMWFLAGLGACDLGAINEKTLADPRQPALIREAIMALPGEAAKRHMARFANALFTRMGGLNPAVKFRYLKAGFDVVGDDEQAREARKVYAYYKDLVTEIRLRSSVDGPAEVGSGRPFGLFVDLQHTREIERESGGFGRYLQNQNQGNMFSYNYGRPLENYRDKFQDAAKQALEEHFEILSVTFQDDKVNSRSLPGAEGWRYTPYAYVLLKARSPKVDTVPPLRLDLDFLDTSGYMILPVESPPVPIDASAAGPKGRPCANLQVVQTLDERQAKDDRLILEIKATARGLVPPLEEIVDLRPGDFRVAQTEDQGVSVSRFDPDGEGNAILSERTWLVTLNAAPGLPERPRVYRFPAGKVEGAGITYQRYQDADLASVGPEITLEGNYGTPGGDRRWWLAGGVVAALLGALLAWRFWPRPAPAAAARFPMPDPVTPFSVLGLLRDIERNNGLPDPKKRELVASIQRLEAHFFAEPTGDAPDLHHIARTWVAQTS
ncbi:hypothetical protein TA3x_002943 [Tundrisphaera sp. TA3]|uniref:hypothetical protein n=1 Tax=Tundrisphaera sp. TA3 TaxID=3435775 RepID=UPI003EBAD55F